MPVFGGSSGGSVSDPLTIGVVNVTDHIAVDGVNLTASGIQYVDVQLDDDQIKLLDTAVQTILAAPVGDTRNFVHCIYGLLDVSHGIYTNIGTQIGLDFGGDLMGVLSVPDMANPFKDDDSAGIYRFVAFPYPTAVLPNLANSYNGPAGFSSAQPLTVSCFNTSNGNDDLGNLTDGHALNTLSLRIWYSIVPTVPFGA